MEDSNPIGQSQFIHAETESSSGSTLVSRIERKRTTASLWWISSISGLTAAFLVILLLNWKQPVEDNAELAATNTTPTPSVTLPPDWEVTGGFQLIVEPADLTRSLEEELSNLQSDLEKARENVERDVKFAL